MWLAPTVARLVEVEAHTIPVQIDDVSRAAAVDVSQADALVVELFRMVEPRSVVHHHLRAEATMAEIRPVARFAIADADDVRETVTGEIGETDRLGSVGEDDARPFLFIERLSDALGGAETLFSHRGVPDERIVFG